MDEMNQNNNVNFEELKVEPEAVNENRYQKPKKKMFGKTAFCVCICLFLMGASAYGAFYWRDSIANEVAQTKQDEVDILQSRIAAFMRGHDAVCEAIQPDSSAIENIIASIETANTQPLEGYMAENVNVILAATEAYGDQDSTQAVLSITDFIGDSSTITWDFSLPDSTLETYSSSEYGGMFKTISVVGKSSDDKVISFSFDCDGNIDQVFMSDSEEIIISN
jgi:hypothetical protein